MDTIQSMEFSRPEYWSETFPFSRGSSKPRSPCFLLDFPLLSIILTEEALISSELSNPVSVSTVFLLGLNYFGSFLLVVIHKEIHI